MDALEEIKQMFFQECEEQLAELESGLLSLENGTEGPDTVNAVFRSVHSIKGGAGAFSLTDLVEYSHIFENTLDELRSGRVASSPELLKLLLRAADLLSDHVAAARDAGTVDKEASQEVTRELVAYTIAGEVNDLESTSSNDEFGFQTTPFSFDFEEEQPSESVFLIKFSPKPSLYSKGNDTTKLIRELKRIGTVEVTCDENNIPFLTEIDPEGAYLTWSITLRSSCKLSDVQEIFEFAEWDSELDISEKPTAFATDADTVSFLNCLISSTNEVSSEEKIDDPIITNIVNFTNSAEKETKQAAAATSVAATIRADLGRVDRLIDLVGELVINQAMLAQRISEAGHMTTSAVGMGLNDLEHLTREIQDCVMSIRAQSVKSIFQRMPRLVREVATMTNKSVRLVTEGENTEVDKTVIDRLMDPLTHMIRNAIDHGIEDPEKRASIGKPEEGTIHLAAFHRSGRIIIEISDDGAGVNRQKVKEIAANKGLIAPDAILTDEEVDNLIFLPGFSTASTITNVSGRGVGMDVVKRSIQSLGGRVSISSRPGHGSTFTMSLPLTLAVLDGMAVTVAGETLVIPLTAIVETLLANESDIHNLGGGSNSKVISIRESFVPLVDVAYELGYRNSTIDPKNGVVILVETEDRSKKALLVDTIDGQRQVVIKSLETNYKHIQGIAAATITGDGKVALILDVDAVIAKVKTETPQRNTETNEIE